MDQLRDKLPTIESEENERLQEAMRQCWNLSRRDLPVEVIHQGDPRKMVFKEILVDDSNISRSAI